MFYLNEQTDCPILTGIHKAETQCTLIMHIDILCKICISIFDGSYFTSSYASVGLKSNVTSASHKDWFYHNLIHSSHCQKNFPNVY